MRLVIAANLYNSETILNDILYDTILKISTYSQLKDRVFVSIYENDSKDQT